MQREKATLLQWLGFKYEFNYSENTVLGGFVGFCLSIFILALAMVSLAVLLMIVVAVVDNGILISADKAEVIRNLGLLLAATVGLPFLVWRSIVAQKQVNVAEQGHITDRINEAVKGLGAEKVVKQIKKTRRYKKDAQKNWIIEDGKPVPALRPDGEPIVDLESFEESVPNLEVRIGGIYALERIALDSPRDHIQIMEIICAYIRENASFKVLNTQEIMKRSVRVDLQAAISVIGRRTKKQIGIEWAREYRLDLREANLAGCDFSNGDFSAAMFDGCCLDYTDFTFAKLVGTSFNNAKLNYVIFLGAELVGTLFNNATIKKTMDPNASILENPSSMLKMPFALAEISGINLMGADISAVTILDFKNTFGTRDTILNPKLELERVKLWELQEELIRSSQGENKINALLEEINENKFVNWSSFDSDDLQVNTQFRDYLEKLDISGFPHFNS